MDVTICPICIETLNDPRCIPCLHTFCQNCLNDHIETECQKKDFPVGFHCPVCCKFIPGSISDNPSLWAESFPKNVIIEFVIRNAEDENIKLCKPCLNDNKEEPAITLCGSCMECLCEGCTVHHKKLTITKDHEVMPLNEIKESFHLETEEYYCCKHDFRYFELFCFDHETPCCAVCSVTEHKGCKMDTIKKAFDHIKKDNESQEMLSEINRVESQLKNLKEAQNEKQTQIEDKADEIRDKTNKMRQDINETLDKLENELLENLAQNMKSTRSAIEGNKETLSDLLYLSNHCKEFLTDVSKRSCNPGFVGGFHKIKKQLKRLKSAKLSLKDAELSATFSNVFDKKRKVGNQFASLCFEEKEAPLFTLDAQSVPNICRDSVEMVRDVRLSYADGTINDILYLENNEKLFICLNDNTVRVGDGFGWNGALIRLKITIFRAAMLRNKIFAVSDKENFYAIELDQNFHIRSLTKININARCFGISVFQDSLLIGSVNLILQMNINGQKKRGFPARGCVVDVVSMTCGNLIYIGRTLNNHFMEDARTVSAIDDNGQELWKYEHPDMKYPMGLTKDCDEHIYITGYFSNNIHMLNITGCPLKIFEHIPNPSRIIYREEGKDFIVVSDMNTIKHVEL